MFNEFQPVLENVRTRDVQKTVLTHVTWCCLIFKNLCFTSQQLILSFLTKRTLTNPLPLSCQLTCIASRNCHVIQQTQKKKKTISLSINGRLVEEEVPKLYWSNESKITEYLRQRVHGIIEKGGNSIFSICKIKIK